MADAPPLAETTAVPASPSSQASISKTRDPNQPLTFRYWSRPTYLQYKLLYDYRRNYYDDVIDYLDWRCRGYSREIPRPQEWAERVLRTRLSSRSEILARQRKDIELLSKIRSSVYSYHYHKWENLVRRYPALTL